MVEHRSISVQSLSRLWTDFGGTAVKRRLPQVLRRDTWLLWSVMFEGLVVETERVDDLVQFELFAVLTLQAGVAGGQYAGLFVDLLLVLLIAFQQ